MENRNFENRESFEQFINNEKMILSYFSADSCNVCKILKPKIDELVRNKFPEVHTVYIDMQENSALSGQLLIFSIPTIILYIEGKETFKFSRNLSMQQLEDTLRRCYDLVI